MLTMALALSLPIGMLGLLLALGRYEEGMLTDGHDLPERHGAHRRRRRWILVPVPHRRREEVA